MIIMLIININNLLFTSSHAMLCHALPCSVVCSIGECKYTLSDSDKPANDVRDE